MRKTLTSGLIMSTLFTGAVQAPAAYAEPAAETQPAATSVAAASPTSPASAPTGAPTETPADPKEKKREDIAQGFVDGLALPDTANPVNLTKQELKGFSAMSSGVSEGDWSEVARGAGQVASVVVPVLLGLAVVGQLVELVMRGIRTANR